MKRRKGNLLHHFLAGLVNIYKVHDGDLSHYRNYDYWQKSGFHIIPNHYYQPIPDTSTLIPGDFGKKELLGVDMNDKIQLKYLDKLGRFSDEFKQFKMLDRFVDTQIDYNFYLQNFAFEGVDALSYYAFIRLLKPKKIVEIGSGWSTKIAAKACLENNVGDLFSIEPYPQQILKKGFPGFSKLVAKRVEDVRIKFFEKLGKGDILFIDSSHTVKIGGDVNYIFFEILPKLKKGVYIHIHDIFLPYDYPKDWVMKERRFWGEQYLLHAFLMYNKAFEVVFARGYLNSKYPGRMAKVFKGIEPAGGGSFWMRKTK